MRRNSRNPMIYTYRNDDFKRSFVKILCGWRDEKVTLHDRLCNNEKAPCTRCKRSSSNCQCPIDSDVSHKENCDGSPCFKDPPRCLPINSKIKTARDGQVVWVDGKNLVSPRIMGRENSNI